MTGQNIWYTDIDMKFIQTKILDEYPPYLQIEPSSICNYRCVFCFETDKSFTTKKNGFMGTMEVDLFKDIIDEAKDNIEFISLASRRTSC